MVCAICSKVKVSNPLRSSDWRLIEVDGDPYYVCKAHFPPDGASEKAFAEAYEKVLLTILKAGST